MFPNDAERSIAYMEGFSQIMIVKTYSLLIIGLLSILYERLLSRIFIEGVGTLFAFLFWDIYLFPPSDLRQLHLISYKRKKANRIRRIKRTLFATCKYCKIFKDTAKSIILTSMQTFNARIGTNNNIHFVIILIILLNTQTELDSFYHLKCNCCPQNRIKKLLICFSIMPVYQYNINVLFIVRFV